jgi:sugar lactone lactonase YvrE
VGEAGVGDRCRRERPRRFTAGDQIAMPADGGTVRLWQLRPLQEEAVVAMGIDSVSAGPDALAFSPDGTRLAVGRGEAGGVYAFDIDDLIRLARDRVTRELPDQECRPYLHLDLCPDA